MNRGQLVGTGAEKVLLLDVPSLFYRSFFALPDNMRSSKGVPTSGLYGFSRLLLKLLREEMPWGAMAAFEGGGTQARRKELPSYKGTRVRPPTMLQMQMGMLPHLIHSFGIETRAVAGEEADDVLASAGHMLAEGGFSVLIVTGDLDLLQAVRVGVEVLIVTTGRSTIASISTASKGSPPVQAASPATTPATSPATSPATHQANPARSPEATNNPSKNRRVTRSSRYDLNGVIERYGIKPELLADWRALAGDPSDNIPGVPGVGPRTASTLLAQYGSLENLITHIDAIPEPALREALAENMESVFLYRKTALLHMNLPLDLTREALVIKPEVMEQEAGALFVELEFKSLSKPLLETMELLRKNT